MDIYRFLCFVQGLFTMLLIVLQLVLYYRMREQQAIALQELAYLKGLIVADKSSDETEKLLWQCRRALAATQDIVP